MTRRPPAAGGRARRAAFGGPGPRGTRDPAGTKRGPALGGGLRGPAQAPPRLEPRGADAPGSPPLPEPPMKYGMNLLLWTGNVTAEHFPLLAKLKAAGFDGVE